MNTWNMMFYWRQVRKGVGGGEGGVGGEGEGS